ncbi:MAG: FAD/NAD(P)-binding protein [Anaerolineae bacterium]|nr:FAD/NAD(P)-binding protein [Anaerolineae bacterium]
MLDWLIIGGGIQGTHLSLYLTRRKNLARDRVRVLDPQPRPLALWEKHSANTGMEYLRSPHAHNLHFDPFSLVTFARTRAGAPLARFTEPYGRPALDLFHAHSAHLIDRYRLNDLRIEGRAEGLTKIEGGWRVETGNSGVDARRVVVAIGNTENPYWPDWAYALREAGAPVSHVFETDFDRVKLPAWEHAVVVGGGITAVQTALALAMTQLGTVTLLMRHATRVHNFDSDPVWIDRRMLEPFHETRDYARRRAIIHEARHRGSMPPDVARDLRTGTEGNLLKHIEGQVVVARYLAESGTIELNLASGGYLQTDRLILATGFDTARPGGAWLDNAVADYGLPTASDGYPSLDPTLCWAEGLYVMGPLAELEVGPTARNFIGARLAAERIGDAL